MKFAPTLFEPIAIVGIGCRFPGGVSDPDSYWNFVESHGDGISLVPSDRYSLDRYYHPDPGAPGKVYVRNAGFLKGHDFRSFDPTPFGISPREAQALDPQQRLLLEVSWEAFENAGVSIQSLAGSATGVFVGGFTLDHMLISTSAPNRPLISSHTSTGMTMTVLSNRLSYTFDLRGPSLTIDTACSSSLVATHLACRSLAMRECEMAIAGGVNMMLSPLFSIVMCKGQFLSPDGRSKAFDAGANGYGRGEGAGVVVLKRLSQAIADGDRIHAVIRATAVNQDGRTDGMPMPSGEAQETLIREACAVSGIAPETVGYIEAHGTGTRAGDPVEASALGRVYGQQSQREVPCRIGSVKTNIGHLEAAAGVAGLIKAALAVKHRRVPPQRAFDIPNPEIDFDGLGLKVAKRGEAWPIENTAAVAAVNSFGYGGTNAHAILAENLILESNAPLFVWPQGRPLLLPLSAHSREALSARAGQLIPRLRETSGSDLIDLGYTLSRKRSHFTNRAVVSGSSVDELIKGLQALEIQEPALNLFVGDSAPGPSEGVVWVLTGMGPQWWAMGRELLAQEPTFRNAAEACDTHFKALAGWSVLEEMRVDEKDSHIRENWLAQPANFILQVALGALLLERGVIPAAIIGHSVGEVAAAYLAGALSLADAVRVAFHRSRIQQKVANKKGSMLAVGLGASEVLSYIENEEDVCIGAENAHDAVTLSGSQDALDRVATALEKQSLFNRRVPVEIAYHSRHMDPLRDELLECLRPIAPQPPSTRMYSTVTGEQINGTVHDADYFWQNARQPVMLKQALSRAIADGFRHFVEVGPHPVLSASIRSALSASGHRGTATHVLKKGESEQATWARAIGQLHVAGAAIQWSSVYPRGRVVDLPNYPWQREVHWLESETSRDERLGRPDAHPLLRDEMRLSYPSWSTEISGPCFDYFSDHQVDSSVVFPGAGYVEAMLAAGRSIHGPAGGVIEKIEFRQVLQLVPDGGTQLTTQCSSEGLIQIHSRSGESSWFLHATGHLAPTHRYHSRPHPSIEPSPPENASVDPASLYSRLASLGLVYGPAFRGLKSLSVKSGEIWAQIEVPLDADSRYILHPAVLDASFQALLSAAPENAARGPIVPVSIERIRVHVPCCGLRVNCIAKLRSQEGRSLIGDLWLTDESGRVLVEVIGLRCQEIPRAEVSTTEHDWLYVNQWQEVKTPPRIDSRLPYFVIQDRVGLAERVATELRKLSLQATVLSRHGLKQIPPFGAALVVLMGDGDADRIGLSHCTELVALVQELPPEAKILRLVIITQGAQTVLHGEGTVPSQSSIWGLGRVIMTERPDLACTLIDVDRNRGAIELSQLALSIACESGEEEVSVRGLLRYAGRIRRTSAENESLKSKRELQNTSNEPVQLGIQNPGLLETLTYRPCVRRSPDEGEVEVEVYAVGLNFKDVMKAMGILSRVATDGSYLGTDLGMEASGRVVRVGEGVKNVKKGDEVFLYCGGALRSYLTVNSRFAIPRVQAHDWVESATYFVFITAWYALVNVARLERGEKVLIHSAAGGVGLAAVQIAQARGAVIFATAGTEEKRAYLRELGISYVMDSRTLDFADQILEVTQGKGVDVVLNSLAGPYLQRSIEIMAACGRFVELGKQDIVGNQSLGLLPFNRSLTFSAIDLDRMANDRPDYFEPLLKNVMAAFASGILKPLPTLTFPAEKVEAAFRILASGTHTGKVVVKLRDREVPVAVGLQSRPLFRADRSYLVTGGTRGFGLEMARWLVEQGVRDLVLASRRGEIAEEDRPILQSMLERGACVRFLSLDVANADAVKTCIQSFGKEKPPLGGVFHAAMVLVDVPIYEQTPDRFAEVMLPKALGAWNLHLATQDIPLDHFVLFSSVSALVGNPSQSSYAAANSFLDGLAHHRAVLGLPALSVNWGRLGDVGAAARDEAVGRHLETIGLGALPPSRALAVFGVLLRERHHQIGLLDLDWDKWTKSTPGTSWRRLADLVSKANSKKDDGFGKLRRIIDGAEPDRCLEAVSAKMVEAAGKVFKLPANRIDAQRPLKEYGLDSLMAVELRLEIQQVTGMEFSAIELLAGASATSLAERALKRLPVEDVSQDESVPPESHPELGSDDLRKVFLERICVQPPYFALESLRREGDTVTAEVTPDCFSSRELGRELGPLSSAEAARHLAILGSCAVASINPQKGRTYYPVRAARLTSRGEGKAQLPASRFRLVARCTKLDRGGSVASAQAEVQTLDGIRVLGFSIEYHVIPESDFRSLFKSYAKPTLESLPQIHAQPNPYAEGTELNPSPFDGKKILAVLHELKPEMCLGHFHGYPAFPVSIMARHVFDLVAEGCRQQAGWKEIRCTVEGGDVETSRFIWAHEQVSFEARPLDDLVPARSWQCDILTKEGRAAKFLMEVASHEKSSKSEIF